MEFVFDKERVIMGPAENPKDACSGCCFDTDKSTCPTIKKGAWTALMCEMYGAVNFQSI